MEPTRNRQYFIKKLQTHGFSSDDIELAMYAYDLTKSAHRTINRDSGERYFEHPREMVYILLDEVKCTDIDEVIIALLHDTGEDTSLFGSAIDSWQLFVKTATFRLTRTFNHRVAEGVILFTKPKVDKIYFKDKAMVMEYYIHGLEHAPKIFLLKMIDRLHNLRSLPQSDVAKIKKQVIETEEVLNPAFLECLHYINMEKEDSHRWCTVIAKIEAELTILKALVS